MGVGCQSRRFNCLFWRETRQRILGHEISPYPEVVRGPENESWRRGPERGKDQSEQLVTGEQRGRPPKQTSLFWRETRQRILGHEISPYPEVVRGPANESWRRDPERGKQERQLAVGHRRAERQAAEVGVDPRRGSQHQTPSREARRQDRVQWRRVSRCLIPVALWNFR